MTDSNMNVLAIIQARGGSKSIPEKNIKDLCGKPLIAWTILAAKSAKTITRVIVSTDDPLIAAVAVQFGAEVPFLRPAEFATDTAKIIGLLHHALKWLEENENYKPQVVVQLKPTNPLRRAEHIDMCVNEFLNAKEKIDSLITVTKSPAHPLKMWKFEDGLVVPFIPENIFGLKEAAKLPRQLLPLAYVQNSCVNIINPDTITKLNSSIGGKIKGVVLESYDAINIDNLLDFEIAELIMNKSRELFAK